MDVDRSTISDDDKRLLVAHYEFYRDLDSGRRAPTTPEQRHFIAACRDTEPPETDHERAYLRFKRAVAAAGLNEADVVAANFVLPCEDADAGVDIPVRLCVDCDHPIDPERLVAIPDATQCMPCKRQKESAPLPAHFSITDMECPRCAKHRVKSLLVWRKSKDPDKKQDYFLGCSRFPECRHSEWS